MVPKTDWFLNIVIPTFNIGQTLEECLRTILAQSLLRDQYEIVLADAGSADATREITRVGLCYFPVCWSKPGMHGTATLQKEFGFNKTLVRNDTWQTKT